MSVELVVEAQGEVLTLTEYLNVQQDAGMDPADPEYTEKIYAHSLLKQGATLALENLKERELVFPLLLNASSKAALTALVQRINTVINSAEAIAVWRDEGATSPTYLQLISGQFDPEFNFRRSGQNWLNGKLRLFVQPLGRYGTNPRALAISATTSLSLTGTTPVLTLVAASNVRGDYPALAKVSTTMTTTNQAPYAIAFSVLPAASYSPWIGASTFAQSAEGGWTAKATTGNGWTFYTGEGEIEFNRSATVYTGPNRVLGVARSNGTTAILAVQPSWEVPKVASFANPQYVPVTTASTNFALVDLGIINVPSYITEPWEFTLKAHGTVQIAGLVMLPDNKTSWYQGELSEAPLSSRQVTFDGVANRLLTVLPEALRPNNMEDASKNARGAIPVVPVGSGNPVLAFFHHFPGSSTPVLIQAEVAILERTRYVV